MISTEDDNVIGRHSGSAFDRGSTNKKELGSGQEILAGERRMDVLCSRPGGFANYPTPTPEQAM